MVLQVYAQASQELNIKIIVLLTPEMYQSANIIPISQIWFGRIKFENIYQGFVIGSENICSIQQTNRRKAWLLWWIMHIAYGTN